MKKQVLSILILGIVSVHSFSQSKIVLPVAIYSEMKATGQLKNGVEYLPINNTGVASVSAKLTTSQAAHLQDKDNRGGGGIVSCSCLQTIDTTYSVAPFTDGTPPDYRSDDGSTGAITFPFDFCLFGSLYTNFFINNNGNISFGGPYGAYTAAGFPDASFIMIAPFWADVNTGVAGSGLVYYKITPTYAIIQWHQVAHYSGNNSELNTFQVIITDGSDPILPTGNNVAFCYGAMQWTAGVNGGFGGTPSTVGVNIGDGINFEQIGRYDQPGMAYDGPSGNNDGVGSLVNESFYINSCAGTNIFPIASGLNNCDTLKICHLGDTMYVKALFLAPEPNQNTTVSVNFNGMSNASTISNSSGNSAYAVVRIIATAANYGNHSITFIATDNGVPIGTTIINANVYVDTVGAPALSPVIAGSLGFCIGGTTTLSVSPTNYDSYQWSTGSALTSVTADTAALYFVTAKQSGCSKSAGAMVWQRHNPTPTIQGFPYTCHNSAFTTTLYSDSLIYSGYHWSTSSTQDSVIVGNGTYTLTVTDAFGCKDSTTFAVTSNAVLVSTTVVNTSILANIQGATYQWLDCNNANASIAGATNQTYTPPVNGTYSVVVSNGFCDDTSACVIFTSAGITHLTNENSITIAPNPFTSQTVITFGEEQKNCSVKIVDVLGKEVWSKLFEGRRKQIVIDKGEMSNGIYFIQINLENKNVSNKKIIVQ